MNRYYFVHSLKLDDFITEQKAHNKSMDEHSRQLARILQQLVDK